MSTYKLTYFDGRARGEPARMLFALAGQKYEDIRLLDILAGRKEKEGVRGEVLINGNDIPRNFKCCSGYVVQDDVVMGTLTVRENLAFSAALRLPSTVSQKEKKERVDETITELGLEDCKDTKVGTMFIRGVSGGERKRTNIGMELVIGPTVLFLDEPTTGLDANTAYTVMSRLAVLSKRGRAIIFSIHQPRFTIFQLFDTLHLLSKGETVYHGSADDSIDYFSSIGLECEAHNNPPDFFLDVIIKNSSTAPSIERDPESHSSVKLESKLEEGVATTEMNNMNANTVDLTKSYKSSRFYHEVEAKAAEIIKLHDNNPGTITLPDYDYASGFFTQVSVVAKRAAINYRRSIQVSVVPLVMGSFIALIMGMVYFQVDTSFPAGTQNRTGAFFFASIFMVFSNISALELFVDERKIYIHESSSGFYRTSSYFISKVLCDLVPMRVLPTLVFAAIYYWMIGFRAEAGAFFIFLLTLILVTFCGTALVFLISIKVGIVSVGLSLVAASNIIMFVFAGVVVNTSSIPDWLEWVKYFSIIRYSVNALSINEFKGLTFCRNNRTDSCITGEEYLSDLDVSISDWDLWQNHVALSCIMIILFTLSYIFLLRVPKHK
nr:broad substrate specificity ATP-binding cassette transporter ABCG2-like [Lytechinus pictus]